MEDRKRKIKETDEERSVRLQRKATKISNHSMYKRIVTALKTRPDMLNGVSRLLVANGALSAHDTPGAVQGEPAIRLRDEDAESRASEWSMLADSSPTLPPRFPPTGEVGLNPQPMPDREHLVHMDAFTHRNYTNFGTTSVKILKQIMTAIEPISLSNGNLKCLIPQGRRECDKKQCLEILEFCTGMDSDFNFPKDHRNLNNMCAMVKAQSERNGRRGRDLQLPVDWGKAGFYTTVRNEDGTWSLQHRFRNSVAAIPAGFLEEGKNDNDDVLVVKFNWSETRACLC